MLDFSLIPRKKDMIETLCTLLRIPSVKDEPAELMPYGKGVFDVLMKMLEIADHMDFDAVNLYSRMGYVDYGYGNETVAILTHLDVVPAGDGWTVPPFEGTIKDGRIYGRGAIDNKGPAVAALYALAALAEHGLDPKKKVRLLFGCDEESGWSDIAYYKETIGEIPDLGFSPDAQFPIINAEKGLLQLALSLPPADLEVENPKGAPILLSFEGGERVNVVPAEASCVIEGQCGAIEKLADMVSSEPRFEAELSTDPGPLPNTIEVTAYGRSAHGSRPADGINAAQWLIKFLDTMPLAKSNATVLLQSLSDNLALTNDGSKMRINREDRSGCTTVNLGYVHVGPKQIEAGLDIRYPITQPESFILERVTQAFNHCDVEKRFALPSHYVDEDSFLVTTLKEVYTGMTGEKAYCKTMGGATYARAFPNCVAFGPLFPGQVPTEHQPDEYIEIDSFIKLADIIADAIMCLSNPKEP